MANACSKLMIVSYGLDKEWFGSQPPPGSLACCRDKSSKNSIQLLDANWLNSFLNERLVNAPGIKPGPLTLHMVNGVHKQFHDHLHKLKTKPVLQCPKGSCCTGFPVDFMSLDHLRSCVKVRKGLQCSKRALAFEDLYNYSALECSWWFRPP